MPDVAVGANLNQESGIFDDAGVSPPDRPEKMEPVKRQHRRSRQ
jgi:hypothetical protein